MLGKSPWKCTSLFGFIKVAPCITLCYIFFMPTNPVPVRFEPELQKLLREGARRTPHKKQELIRITLRRYLPAVIEAEAAQSRTRLTNIDPWPKAMLAKAYKRVGKEWDTIEEAATRAQGRSDFGD